MATKLNRCNLLEPEGRPEFITVIGGAEGLASLHVYPIFVENLRADSEV